MGGGLSPCPPTPSPFFVSSASCFSSAVLCHPEASARTKKLCFFGWVRVIFPSLFSRKQIRMRGINNECFCERKKKVSLLVFLGFFGTTACGVHGKFSHYVKASVKTASLLHTLSCFDAHASSSLFAATKRAYFFFQISHLTNLKNKKKREQHDQRSECAVFARCKRRPCAIACLCVKPDTSCSPKQETVAVACMKEGVSMGTEAGEGIDRKRSRGLSW